jgi:phage portal protein BeeE
MSLVWDILKGRYNESLPSPAQNQSDVEDYNRQARHTFSSGTPTLIGSDYETWNALVGHSYAQYRVSRAEAMSVPAIKAARDIFCGKLGTLPLHTYNAAGETISRQLMDQPERFKGLVRSKTLADTIDDLFFYANSLWVVRDREWSLDGPNTGYPQVVERIHHSRWVQDSETSQIMVDGDKTPAQDCILFVSGNDPALDFGGPIRALLAMERAAGMYIARPEMSEYFQPNDGSEPDDEEIQDFLADWATTRSKGITGFIPENLTRNETKRMTAEELQLTSAREFGISEVSRMFGISPNWLALNITSRTYNNAESERRDFIEGPAAPYIKAIEETLSLGAVTPRGQYVRLNLDAFLRANTLERYQAHNLAITGGWKTVNEIRALENLPPIAGGDVLKAPSTAPPTPGVPNG